MRRKFLTLSAMVMLVLFIADSALAQQLAGSFDQLRVLVKPGDTLTVTDAAGETVKGRLSGLTSSSISVNVSGQVRQFLNAEVDTIQKRGPDSLKNGALVGLSIGGGLAAMFITAALGAGEDGGHWYWVALPAYAGMGAGIGAGVDALIEGRRVIYARTNSRQALSLAPMLGRDRRGIALSVRLGN